MNILWNNFCMFISSWMIPIIISQRSELFGAGGVTRKWCWGINSAKFSQQIYQQTTHLNSMKLGKLCFSKRTRIVPLRKERREVICQRYSWFRRLKKLKVQHVCNCWHPFVFVRYQARVKAFNKVLFTKTTNQSHSLVRKAPHMFSLCLVLYKACHTLTYTHHVLVLDDSRHVRNWFRQYYCVGVFIFISDDDHNGQ